MTVREAAEVLRCSERQVRRFISDDRLSVSRLGRRLVIKPESIVELLERD